MWPENERIGWIYTLFSVSIAGFWIVSMWAAAWCSFDCMVLLIPSIFLYNYANNEWKDCIYIKIIGVVMLLLPVSFSPPSSAPTFFSITIRFSLLLLSCALVSAQCSFSFLFGVHVRTCAPFYCHISYVNVISNHNPFHSILQTSKMRRTSIQIPFYTIYTIPIQHNMKFKSCIALLCDISSSWHQVMSFIRVYPDGGGDVGGAHTIKQ